MKTNRRTRALSRSISSLIVLSTALTTTQAANIWDGGGGDNLWSTLTNWDNDAFPGYGTLTFSGSTQTTNVVDASISQNMLLWSGASAWTLNNAGGAVISLFDNSGAQAKVENQSSGAVTVNAPITFAANNGTPANPFGEINAVNGDITFGATGALTVNGTSVNGLKFWGGAGRTVTFNNTVSATGKYFATTGAGAVTIGSTAAVTVGNVYVMNGGSLNLSGGSITHDANTGIRLGGDFLATGNPGNQNLALSGTVNLTPAAGGLTYAGLINSVTGNTSGNLLVDSQNTSGTNTLSGGIFLDSPLKMQVAAGGTLAATGVVSGAAGLTKQGNGTLTLSGVNTFTGGTTLAAGTLNVNNNAALGNTATGALTISGNSTLNNTSAGLVTTTTAKALNLNADLTFTGTQNINLNGGVLTLGGAAGTRTLSIPAGILQTGTIAGAAGLNLSKTGAGTLFLSSGTNSGIAGTLDVQAGKVQVAADVTVTGLSGSGTIENGGAGSKWFFVNNAADFTYNGNIIGNATNAAVHLGLQKNGSGTLTLGGTIGSAANGADTFEVRNGKVVLTNTANVSVGGINGAAAYGSLSVGNVAAQNGILEINGAAVRSYRNGTTPTPMINLGTVANGRGFVKMTGGTVDTFSSTVGELWVSNNATSFGEWTQSGGAVTTGSWVAIGRSGPGIVNLSGGSITVNSNPYTHGSFAGATGVTNLSGTGTININSTGAVGMYLAEAGNGILNMSGGTLNIAAGATSGLNLTNGVGAGIGNLNGGTVTAAIVRKGGTGSGILNFNGGTLRANAASATYMTGLTSANIYASGATIDSNGNAITIAQPLLAPAGSGITTIPVATGGAGYIDAPLVIISAGGGTGATAVANVSGGVITGYTITNAGTGYTSAPTVTITGGGATTAGTVGSATFAANATTGGLTKTGAGVLTISSTTSSYGGATTISGGTLAVGAISNGGAASSLGASSNAAANLVLNNGALEFTGASGSTDRSFTVSTGATGTLNVSNAAGVLTISGSSATTNGNFTKIGAGVLSLTGASNLTGTTTVSAGILGLAAGTAAGPIVVSGGRFTAGYQTVATLNTPALTLGSSGGVDFDFGAGNDLLNVTTASTGLTLGTGTSLNLYNAGGVTAFSTNGTYTLFDYNTAYAGALNGAFIVSNSQPGKIYSIADNTGATTIELTIGTAVTTAWNVDGGGSANTAGNWTAGVPNSIGATATFGSILTAPNAPATVTVDGAKTVGNIVFSNANTYNLNGGATDILTLNNGLGTATISATLGSHSVNAPIALVNPSALNAGAGATLTIGGDISGAAGITKIGAGTASLAGNNSYTTTTVSAGTLQVGNGGTTGTLGSGAASIGTGATLAFNRSNAATIANNISGAGSLTQIGSGTTTYTGAASHTGGTTVTAGSLVNQGTLSGAAAISVTGGSLVNEGTINGPTSLVATGGAVTLQASSATTIAGLTTIGSGTGSASLSLLGGASATLNGTVAIGSTAGFSSGLTVNTTGSLATNSIVNVGVNAGVNGSFTMTSGTVNQTGGVGIIIGANGGTGTYSQTGGTLNTGTANPGFGVAVGTANSVGNATISGGSIVAPGEIWVGNDGAAGQTPHNNGTLTMTGGSMTAGSWIAVGRNTAVGTINLNGGTITKNGATGNLVIVGSLGGTGTINQTAGALNITAGGIALGEPTGTTPALATWDMQGGSSTITGTVVVGWKSSEGIWNVGGSSNVSVSGRLVVAAETSSATVVGGNIVAGKPVGTVNMTGGTVTFGGAASVAPFTLTGDSRIGGDNSAVSVGAQATVNVSGGTLNFGSNLQLGAYGTGAMTVTGTGVVNSTAGFPVVGRFAGSNGTLNVALGGVFNQTNAANALIIGEEGTGTLNVLTGGLVDVKGLFVGHAATGNATVNITSGVLSTGLVQRTNAASTAAVNFDDGTLKAKASNANFFPGFTNTQIKLETGGANIDTNGFDIGITQNLTDGTTPGGGLDKEGAGTLTLAGAETYTGLTNVNGGVLNVTGSISGSVNVNNGGTLGGTGTVGAVTAASGGIVAPGLSPGQLNTGAVSLGAGSTLSLEVNGTTAGSYDVLNVTGGVTLAGNLSLSGTYFTTPAITNDLFFAIINDSADAISGTFAGIADGSHVFAANGQDYLVSYFGDSVGGTTTGGNDFVLQAVPEPGSAALLLGGLAMLAGRRRRTAK